MPIRGVASWGRLWRFVYDSEWCLQHYEYGNRLLYVPYWLFSKTKCQRRLLSLLTLGRLLFRLCMRVAIGAHCQSGVWTGVGNVPLGTQDVIDGVSVSYIGSGVWIQNIDNPNISSSSPESAWASCKARGVGWMLSTIAQLQTASVYSLNRTTSYLWAVESQDSSYNADGGYHFKKAVRLSDGDYVSTQSGYGTVNTSLAYRCVKYRS